MFLVNTLNNINFYKLVFVNFIMDENFIQEFLKSARIYGEIDVRYKYACHKEKNVIGVITSLSRERISVKSNHSPSRLKRILGQSAYHDIGFFAVNQLESEDFYFKN